MLTVQQLSKAQLCISLSARPGSFGTLIHNAGFHALGLNFLYKSFATSDIAGAIAGVRALGIRGCSISMPFKESVIQHLDSLDTIAQEIGAVNTIVNENGHLRGFNTDVTGVLMSIERYAANKNDSILVLGGGGVARAILQALKILGQKNVTLCVRDANKYFPLKQKFGVNIIEWAHRHDTKASILINATPIGMSPNIDEVPVAITKLNSLSLVMDVIVSPRETRLVQDARNRKLIVVNGLTLALNQAYEQFTLYTGVPAPRDAMQQAAESLV